MTAQRKARPIVVGVVMALTLVAPAWAAERRIVFVGVHADESGPENARRAIEDVVRAELPQATKVRDFALVSLDQVSGLPEVARACERSACRRDIAGRLAATHVLAARLEVQKARAEASVDERRAPMSAEPGRVLLVKPGDLKKDQAIDISIPRPETLVHGLPTTTERTVGRTFRVTLWLEAGARDEIIDAVRLEGEVPFLVGQTRVATDKLLEAVSPRDVVARERLRKTALGYEKAGRTRDAVRSYRRAMSTAPFHPDAAELLLEVVRVHDQAGQRDEATEALVEWIEGYGPTSAWGRAGIGGDDVQARLTARATALVFDRATTAHHAAEALAVPEGLTITDETPPELAEKKRQRDALLATALASYRLFVEAYPTHQDAPRAALYAAEVLFDGERYDEAADAYAVSAAVTHAGQRDAAHGAVYALEREVARAGGDGRIAPFDPDRALRVPPSERAIPSLLRRYVEALDRSVLIDPQFEFTPVFALRAAQVHAAYGHREAARSRAEAVVAAWPRTQAAERARELLKSL